MPTSMPAASPASNLTTVPSVVPQPTQLEVLAGDGVTLTPESRIVVPANRPDATAVARYLAGVLRASTGYPLPIQTGAGPSGPAIVFELSGHSGLGPEGYTLRSDGERVTLTAATAEGLFRGAQTLRQLLPASVEATERRPGPWRIPAVNVTDTPRFRYRGMMLDVARHFFPVADVKRVIDLVALYKVNVLHLHLSDDQGWRIAIDSRPKLATEGGRTQVGGGRGGYYTPQQYAEIVAYAADRYVTVVPEIDSPGHTNAALVAYPELNGGDAPPRPYTGTEVGFSTVATDREATYEFFDDVWREIAAATPGPYVHIGGDEAHATQPTDYVGFLKRLFPIPEKYGKRVIGWQEIAAAPLPEAAVVQCWNSQDARAADLARTAVEQGARLVLSPADRAYLDMKYHPGCPYGLHWAGYVPLRQAYDWDPAALVPGVGEDAILGVEAPLWTETVTDRAAIEFMTFPRLAAIAEVGWSVRREWESFRARLAGHGPRWEAMGVRYFPAPEVSWHAPTTGSSD